MEDENILENDEMKSVEQIIKDTNESQEEKKKPKRNYKKRKPKEVKVVPSDKVVAEIEEIEEMCMDEDELKAKLCEDLQVLEYKFKDHIDIKLRYSYPETSIKELSRQKSLFLRLVNESASVSDVIEAMTFGVRGLEKVSNSLNLVDINGLSEDLSDKREELTEIIKELVDCGQIQIAELTPEIKLVMCLTNIAVRRLEKNRSKNEVSESVAEKLNVSISTITPTD